MQLVLRGTKRSVQNSNWQVDAARTDDVNNITPYKGFTPSQAYLVHSFMSKQCRQLDDFVCAEQLVIGRQFHTLFGHAVFT
jgi:hypothetical protein